MASRSKAQTSLDDTEKQKNVQREKALQNNLALMKNYLGGRDRYGRAMPTDIGGALGVVSGHLLGEAIQRWLNRDKPVYDNGTPATNADVVKTRTAGNPPDDGDNTSPETGWYENYTPALFKEEAINNWNTAVNNLGNRQNLHPFYDSNAVLPIGNVLSNNINVDGINSNGFNFNREYWDLENLF